MRVVGNGLKVRRNVVGCIARVVLKKMSRSCGFYCVVRMEYRRPLARVCDWIGGITGDVFWGERPKKVVGLIVSVALGMDWGRIAWNDTMSRYNNNCWFMAFFDCFFLYFVTCFSFWLSGVLKICWTQVLGMLVC